MYLVALKENNITQPFLHYLHLNFTHVIFRFKLCLRISLKFNFEIMNSEIKSQPKDYKDINLGVVIIFFIVTIVFLLSLTKSNYAKEIFSQKTEIRK